MHVASRPIGQFATNRRCGDSALSRLPHPVRALIFIHGQQALAGISCVVAAIRP